MQQEQESWNSSCPTKKNKKKNCLRNVVKNFGEESRKEDCSRNVVENFGNVGS
jgi:hypothetical protein